LSAFETFTPIGAKDVRRGPVFLSHSGGLKSNRDAWVYNYSAQAVEENVRRMVGNFNAQVDAFRSHYGNDNLVEPERHIDAFLDLDPKKFSWDRADKARLLKGGHHSVRDASTVPAIYRPFNKEHVYFDRLLNNTVYQLPKIFPTKEHPNIGIYCVGAASAVPFSVLMVDSLPDLHVTGAGSGGQFFPRYIYAPEAEGEMFSEPEAEGIPAGWTRIDNISDAALTDFRAAFGEEVEKDAIFFYVYGLLHAGDYRTKFAADLKRMLPRIPKVGTAEIFGTYVKAGRELTDLHVGYETVKPWALTETITAPIGTEDDEIYQVQKMTFAAKSDRSTIVVNPYLNLSGIPDDAYDYMLGSRSAIEWIMERYQVKTDKASGIVNNPNDWAAEVGDPRYIVDLLRRIVTVSIKTMEIVKSLPPLGFPPV
jgi:predicted helicase